MLVRNGRLVSHVGPQALQTIHHGRLRWNIIPWRFGSEKHFRFFSWVISVGEPSVNLPGCMTTLAMLPQDLQVNELLSRLLQVPACVFDGLP